MQAGSKNNIGSKKSILDDINVNFQDEDKEQEESS